jgi:hypothetical protein
MHGTKVKVNGLSVSIKDSGTNEVTKILGYCFLMWPLLEMQVSCEFGCCVYRKMFLSGEIWRIKMKESFYIEVVFSIWLYLYYIFSFMNIPSSLK